MYLVLTGFRSGLDVYLISHNIFGRFLWIFDYFYTFISLALVGVFGPYFTLLDSDELVAVKEEELINPIQNYCNKLNIKSVNLYALKDNLKTTESNAFYIDLFGKRRLGIFLSCLTNCVETKIISINSIISYVANEMYHYKHKRLKRRKRRS